jgi:hypothetical protein
LKVIPIPKIPRKCVVEEIVMLLFITEKANNIEEKRKKQRGNIVKGQRNG